MTITTSNEDVKWTAEDGPHKIWWQGRQWLVTAYGIEARDGQYPIAIAQLDDIENRTDLPRWPLHMAEKQWVDVDDFATAFMVALTLHERGRAFAEGKVLEAIEKSKAKRLSETAYKAWQHRKYGPSPDGIEYGEIMRRRDEYDSLMKDKN